MRSIASSLAFFCALALQAQDPNHEMVRPAPARQEQTLESIKQFASTHLDRYANLACVQVGSPDNTKTMTIEFSDAAHRGAPSNVDTGNLIQDIFAVSSGTEFYWSHSATLNGKILAVYNYSFRIGGQTHAGSIFADSTTGAITRITSRGADAAAHLFCTPQTR
jgi:hypothetical protein